MSFHSEAGTVYGRLTVIKKAGTHRHGRNAKSQMLCQCECGNTKIVLDACLKSGRTISCGCAHRERAKQLGLSRKRHGRCTGKKPSGAWRSWRAMMQRCCDKNSRNFPLYGGRGIKVCDRWNTSFEDFLEDMSEPPPKHSIDRIDNSGHYSCGKCSECLENDWPANCQWATAKQQGRNKRNNHLVTHGGLTLTLTEWSERNGLPRNLIGRRLQRGWEVGLALTAPPDRSKVHQRRLDRTRPELKGEEGKTDVPRNPLA